VLDVMEVEKLIESKATIELIPKNIPVLMNLA